MLARGSGASSSVGEEVGVGIGMGVGVEPYYSVPVGSAGCAGQHWSQPTSPTPTHTSRQPPNLYQHVHKDDDSKFPFSDILVFLNIAFSPVNTAKSYVTRRRVNFGAVNLRVWRNVVQMKIVGNC